MIIKLNGKKQSNTDFVRNELKKRVGKIKKWECLIGKHKKTVVGIFL
jgi:hypothetical protein